MGTVVNDLCLKDIGDGEQTSTLRTKLKRGCELTVVISGTVKKHIVKTRYGVVGTLILYYNTRTCRSFVIRSKNVSYYDISITKPQRSFFSRHIHT